MSPSRFRPRCLPSPRGAALALAAALSSALLLASSPARADDGKPFSRKTPTFSLGAGVGFGERLTTLSFSGSGGYYIVDGLELGGQVSDTLLLWSPETKTDFPGIDKHVPSNILKVTPTVRWVFLRTRWFSPYLRAGVGPTFLNNGGGVLGHWLAQPGAYIGVGRHVFIDVGVSFSMNFPTSKCREAFTYTPTSDSPGVEVTGTCDFQWAPRLGLGFAF